MSARTKKAAPVTVSDEHNEVKIYTVKSRTKTIYQISFYRAGQRLRKTFSDLGEAKREARMQLSQLAGERLQARVLSAAEMESCILAMRKLEPTGVPLHVCAEIFAQCSRALKGRSLVEAADYYLRHFDPERPRKPLRDLSLEFVESRRSAGASEKYLTASRSVMRILLRAYAGRSLDDIDAKGLDEMLQRLEHLKNRSRNSYRIILVCFGNFLKKRGYLPEGKASAFDKMMTWRNEVEPVSIYTPDEMRTLTANAHLGILPYVVIGAFAGLRTAEICRLDWSDIKFDRGFIECEARMTKTRSRRLVPISANLRAWLEPIAQPNGKVIQYLALDQALKTFHRNLGFGWKRNALRHSYISYRLAQMPDTARVALECGNSPDVIFKHYRELVTPEQAGDWFSILPTDGFPQNAPYYKRNAVGKKRVWRNLKVPKLMNDELGKEPTQVPKTGKAD